ESVLYRMERFVGGKANRLALCAAADFLYKKSGQSLVITGSSSTGKTHLLKGVFYAWRPKKSAAYLSMSGFSESGFSVNIKKAKAELKKLYDKKLVCLDDLDAARGTPEIYDAVFHLFNAVTQKGGFLAFAMRRSPTPVSSPFLPDYLSSRLLSGMVTRLKKPAERDRKKILKKLAEDVQLNLTPGALDYVLERAPRSIPDLANFLENLERSLSAEPKGGRRKRIGLQLIRRVITLMVS
ncbi:MAG: DnaA/Hda family protein, partial [Nitrospinota bacterium]